MSESRAVNFIVQIAVMSNDAKETDNATRDLLGDIRETKLAAAYPIRPKPAAPDATSTDPLILGNLKVAVEPVALPQFLEFVHAWALQREGHVVRLKLQPTVTATLERSGESERQRTFTLRGRDGRGDDVDYLMGVLETEDDVATSKLVDFALSLVNTEPGKERIRHYLFEGTLRQRNYAALYFKRLGVLDLLEEAVKRGCVSAEQAFSK